MDPVDALIMDEAETTAHRVLVIDDNSGALTTAAAARWPEVLAYCDSLNSQRRVAAIDRLSGKVVERLDPDTLSGVNLVLLRLPKAVGAVAEYAQRLALLPGVRVVAGGRDKHLSRAMNAALATRFERVWASRGRQKSRVLHAEQPQPGPVQWPRAKVHPELGLTLCAHGATFAGTSLDAGTRLLLAQFDRLPACPTALDLGSGNGVLAATLARRGYTVTAIDESRAAVAATRATADANALEIEVRLDDGLTAYPPDSLELIVCNPPFHVGAAKDSTPALGLFADAGRVLVPGGEFWAVFNAHLPYLPALRRNIGSTEIVARDRAYLVTRSVAR